ncbi:Transcriptional regulator, AbiEi antitoxin, Type IV TA system [Blastococcus fimeti]|nr:Transcriptional regulator, AbiEi antitoxin, Type IV TA system [Blastococcus fimeti]
MHPLLRAAAERQSGIVTASDARRAGYGSDEVQRLCASGRWVRLRRGIYTTPTVLAQAQEEGRRHELDCLAVLIDLDRPDATVSHGSAVHLHGLPARIPAEGLVRLTDPWHNRSGRGFRMTRSPLDPAEVGARGRLRVTTAQRALVDHARESSLEDAVIAMDAALLVGKTTQDGLLRAVDRARDWPGGPAALRAVALADGRAESPLETRGRLRIVGAGLPTPQLQVEIWVGGRFLAVVDGWFDDAAVAVEFDGRVKYTDPWRDRTPGQVLWEEKRREDGLRALDIRVVRIADADVGFRWAETERRLRQLTSTPGPAERRFTVRPRAHGLLRSG